MQFIEYMDNIILEDTPSTMASSAPKTGIYKTKSGMYYLVVKESYSATYIGNTVNFSEIKDPKPQQTSEDFLLKLVAISQKPELSVQLTQGNS